MNPKNQSLTALPGVRVGHWSNTLAQTGCSVILLPKGGAVASCEVRGGAPGTRETALLEPSKLVDRIHAIVLSGGSAFGLAAAQGVVDYLESQGEGVPTPGGRVPIVPSAVIYDLATGDARVRPGAKEGWAAATAANGDAVANGRLGAGTGALCGKYLGLEHAEPGGLGNACLEFGGALVAALAVVNPHGDVLDEHGRVLAGARHPDGTRPTRLGYVLAHNSPERLRFLEEESISNTTLLVVGTTCPLDKLGCRRLAEAAQSGLAARTWPAHTPFDGDTGFAFSVGGGANVALPALLAATQIVVAQALERAVAPNTP